jgi:hypothetical protein
MKLASEMKNLSEGILASFKQRVKETEERVKNNVEFINEVQKTLDGLHKDHQEMAAVINANAFALRKGLAHGEKERLSIFNNLMSGIHGTIGSIQKEVAAIQSSTFNLINEFAANRAQMADELDKFFAQGKADRVKNEKNRMKEFDSLMKNINDDIKNINDEVLSIFKNTNDMLSNFEKEHQDMSAELRAELSKNLADRVEYTRTLLNGFQKRLSEISKENQKMAQKLRKDLANGETERLNEYKEIMNSIHATIKGIRKEIKVAQKAMAEMLGGFSQDRSQASAEWNKMQETITQIKKNGPGSVKAEKKVEKKAESKVKPVEKTVEALVIAPKAEETKEVPVAAKSAAKIEETPVKAEPIVPMSLEDKIVDYINKHPKGVRISEMEKPLGETRMKLGYIAKNLLDSGKIQKIDNTYYPKK